MKGEYMHGQGKKIYPNSYVFEGSWKKGKINGHGKMIHADGSEYEGEWLNNKANG